MQQLAQVIRQMIDISDEELSELLRQCSITKYKRYDVVSEAGVIPNEIYFIKSGLIRVIISDKDSIDHTIHFALENQFIADYSAFILQTPAAYTLSAEEDTTVVTMPRSAIQWGYDNLASGDKLGRLIAEFYFIYQDKRLKDFYTLTPKERYDQITEKFWNIHNRVPQHQIASYLGITPVHLSRLKKAQIKKT